MKKFLSVLMICFLVSCDVTIGDVREVIADDTKPLEINYRLDSIAFYEAHNMGYMANYLDFLDSFPIGPYSQESKYWISVLEKSDSLKQVFKNSERKIPKRDVLIISVSNSLDSWKIQDKKISKKEAFNIIKEFLINPSKKEIYPKNPSNAIISINFPEAKSKIAHKYFIEVRELYENFYNEYSNYYFGRNYTPILSFEHKKKIHNKLPFQVVLNGISLPQKPQLPPPPHLENN